MEESNRLCLLMPSHQGRLNTTLRKKPQTIRFNAGEAAEIKTWYFLRTNTKALRKVRKIIYRLKVELAEHSGSFKASDFLKPLHATDHSSNNWTDDCRFTLRSRYLFSAEKQTRSYNSWFLFLILPLVCWTFFHFISWSLSWEIQ